MSRHDREADDRPTAGSVPSGGVLGPDRSPMQFRHPGNDGQPDTAAFGGVGSSAAIEAVKDPIPVLRSDPGARVAYLNGSIALGHGDWGVGRAELVSISQQIG